MRRLVEIVIGVMTAFSILNYGNAAKLHFKLPKLLRDGFQRLEDLLAQNTEPRGKPFTPLVAKPRPSQRVAIVGAGLSGLHMSYLLKKKGFNNVVILEKESRIGGKVMSVWYDEIPHELGAVYTSTRLKSSVHALAKELGVDDFVPQPTNVGLWLDWLPVPIPFSQYVIDTIKEVTKASNTFDAIKELLDAAFYYTILHHRLFGKYENELMHKPCKRVLSQMNQTFMSYLRNHRILALYPILVTSHTTRGYGHLDDVSALYGLLWNTPRFLMSRIELALGISGSSNSTLFRYGFQQLTDKLAVYADIHLNVDIKKIQRDPSGVTIRYYDGEVNCEKIEIFDFLIWAADAREALRVLHHTSSVEKEFLYLRNTWLTATLFNSRERCLASPPLEYWLSNIVYKRDHSVWSRRNSKLSLTGREWPSPEDLKSRMSYVSYQMSECATLKMSQINETFNHHFKKQLGLYDVDIIGQKTWNYFPRFSTSKAAEGIHWKILESQGKRKTWYIGSSVIFESTSGVLDYNQLMMRRMEL